MARLEENFPRHAGTPGSPAGFELSVNPSGSHVLKIWGRLPPSWTGYLSAGLSRNRINIIRGTARKIKTSWTAEFEISPARFASDLKNIDFLSLALNGVETGHSPEISLDEFTLGGPDSNNGALFLEVKARDQLGFLGSLLNRLAFYTLFPEEMVIETENGRILDRLWIKGLGGSTPSDSAINTLRQNLDMYLAGR